MGNLWSYGSEDSGWDAYFIRFDGMAYKGARETGGYDPRPFGLTYRPMWKLLLDLPNLKVSEYTSGHAAPNTRYQILVRSEQGPSS